MPVLPLPLAELAQDNQRKLQTFTRARVKRLKGISARAIAKLEPKLRGQPLTEAGFRRSQDTIALFIATNINALTRGMVEQELLDSLLNSSVMGHLNAMDEMEAWMDYYAMEIKPVNLTAVLSINEDFLIDRYQQSLSLYGVATSNALKVVLEDAQFSFEDKEDLIDRVATIIDGQRWRAERIVRTETLNAYNSAFHQTLLSARDSGFASDVQKTCIVTLDARTAQDSMRLVGQVRDLEEAFVDGQGRRYTHPPGRPNDREKEVPWFPEDSEVTEVNEDAQPVDKEDTPTKDWSEGVSTRLHEGAKKTRRQKPIEEPLTPPVLDRAVEAQVKTRDRSIVKSLAQAMVDEQDEEGLVDLPAPSTPEES